MATEVGSVASDGAQGPRQRPAPRGLKGGHGERLQRREQPQQAPSAQGKQVMRSAPGANLLHSGALTLTLTLGSIVSIASSFQKSRDSLRHPLLLTATTTSTTTTTTVCERASSSSLAV
eukprot:scaffold28796_cov60-Phaeocystis_antarctica.AAC.4